MKINFVILFVLSLLASIACETSKKLNYPRVLLPIFQKISIQFTLEVIEKGCFKWTSSRNDLIQIAPIYDSIDDNECSYRATVTVLTKEKRRNTAFVLAEDLDYNDVLRCDVILDVINQLDILTTTRELYLEEAPETFELIAEDSQGNIFTTLEGVEFEWSIKSLNYDSDVIKFLTFSESKYHEVPKSLQKFEILGIKGFMVLLEGVNTGTAKVSVRLPYQEYKHVPTIEVDIVVLANIILDPSDVHMMLGDTVDFRILQLKMGKLQEINLSNQYYLEIEDENIAKISGNRVTSKNYGQTLIILRDRNVRSNIMGGVDAATPTDITNKLQTPKATLTVAKPEKITINLLPYYNWITIEGEKHDIAIDLYTRDDQKLLLGSRYKIHSEFNETLFYVLKQTQNGSRIYGEAVKAGTNTIKGTFEKLNAVAEMQIYNELVLKPQRVYIPYDPKQLKQHRIKFIATGGDGNYQWNSLNSNLIHITQNGVAETLIKENDINFNELIANSLIAEKPTTLLLHTSIKVALKRNLKIYRNAEIYFLRPIKLEIVEYNFETSLNDYVYVHIALYTKINDTLMSFTTCDNLNFIFEFSNPLFEREKIDETISPPPSTFANNQRQEHDKLPLNACHVMKFRSINLGMTQLRISYTYMDTLLKDEITLNVFEKLEILDPLFNEIILPIGASRNIIYLNGPQKVFNIEADLIKNLDYDKTIAKIDEIILDDSLTTTTSTATATKESTMVTTKSSKPIYAFTILCKNVGNTQLKLQIYNMLLNKNFLPYKKEFVTNIYCVKPRFINLYAVEKLKKNCPIELRNSLLYLKNNKEENIEIEIDILDNKNRKLMNITSLIIDWKILYDKDTIIKNKNINCYRNVENSIIEKIQMPYKNYLMCSITDINVNLKIRLLVTDYDKNILNYYGIKPETPSFGVKRLTNDEYYKPLITNEINFMSVNATVFPFESISILLSNKQQERIRIDQGSGYYEFYLSEKDIISVDFDIKTKELIITPHNVGNVQIELFDRCLMTEPSHLFVSIVLIASIKIEMLDRVQQFKTIEAILKIYDTNGDLLNIDHNNLDMYELHHNIINPSIINVRLSNTQSGNEIRYVITGTEVGDTKITFHSGYGNRMISSESRNIQVFPQLSLYPKNSTLIVGSSIQIYHKGGPRPDLNIVYVIQNQNIVSMDSANVIGKKLGETKIIGRYIGLDSSNKPIIYSEDSIQVHVIPLDEIRIRTPLIRIKSGATMPAAVWGTPNISPMVLGTLESVRFIWSTNQPDVVRIFGIFSGMDIEYKDEDLISVRINALNPGKAKIQVTVILSNGKRLTSSVEITVFKILELESPKKIIMDSILMAPQSTIKLKSNIDDVVYKLDNSTNGIIKVSLDGVVKSTENLGRDVVVARTHDQSLSIGITVKNIHYILASIQYPSLKLKYIENKIPKGIRIILKISLHDNLGNEFSYNIDDMNAIKYEMSHKDTVDMQIGNNLTLSMNVRHEVNNMVAISLRDNNGIKHAEDFIKITSLESKNKFPIKTILSVGDIVCFETPLTISNYWSSDENILSINEQTGVARILNNRFKYGEKITVTNGNKLSNYIKFDVEVREADKINFLKPYDVLSGDSYHSHLIIRNHLQIDKLTNVIAKNFTKCLQLTGNIENLNNIFKCRLISQNEIVQKHFNKNYHVIPSFDSVNGFYSCKIELKTESENFTNILKFNDIMFDLEASLINGVSDTTRIRVVPNIKVYPSEITSDKIVQQGIIVQGADRILDKVEIKASHPNKFELTPYVKSHGNHIYKARFISQLSRDEEYFVEIHSPLSLENIQIPIEITDTFKECSYGPLRNLMFILTMFISNLGMIFSAIGVLMVSLFVYVYCFPQRNRRSTRNETRGVYFRSKTLRNLSGGSVSCDQMAPRTANYPVGAQISNISLANVSSQGNLSNSSNSSESEPSLYSYGESSLTSLRKIDQKYL